MPLLLLAVALAAAAEEKPPSESKKEAPPATAGDAIAVAKREFDAVRASRSMTNAGAQGELLRLGTPELHLAGNALPSPSKRGDATSDPRKKSANWLVDAMTAEERRAKAAKSSRPGSPREEEPRDEPVEFSPLVSGEKAEAPEKNPKETVINPLDRYMAVWLTPQDLTLLRPVLDSNAASGRSGDMLGAQPTGESWSSLGRELSAPASVPRGLPDPRATSRENPYLEALTLPAMRSNPAPELLANVPAPAATAKPIQPPPEAIAPPKNGLPNFVKPREDEKFNRQMKRF